MNFDDFVGRDAEARSIAANVENKHSTLLIAEAGMGKTALLEYLTPLLQEMGRLVLTSRTGPGFGSWLREVFEGLWNHRLVETTNDLTEDWKAFGKKYRSNEEKAKQLVHICEQAANVIITIDDAAGVTPTSRPWLIKFVESCTVVAAIDPAALKKGGTKRFWKLFDEVRLEQLNKGESAKLLDKLVTRYRVNADDMEIYRRSVLDLAQGSPFELNRLVKHHSSTALVRSREIISGSHVFVERDTKQIALMPIVLIMSAFVIAWRYIARVQGDMDGYVLSAIGLGLMIVFAPFLRSALKPRSK